MVYTPFPYQEQGAAFLAAHPYALLADEMGVGKTAQAIIAAIRDVGAKKILVLCPASVRPGWLKELPKFIAEPPPIRVMESAKDKPMATGITVCSYDMAVRKEMGLKLLNEAWDLVILDEEHYLKEITSKRTKFVFGTKFSGGPKSLLGNTFYCWALTGTPTPNNAGELFPIMKAFGIYQGSYMDFIYRYCMVVDSVYGPKIVGNNKKHLPELKAMINRFTLRRKWADVDPQRPSLLSSEISIDQSECDRDLLDQIIREEDTEAGRALREYLETGDGEDLETADMATYRRCLGLVKVKPLARRMAEELELGVMDKVLIFAHHREAVEGYADALARFGAVKAYGGMTPAAKQQAFEQFKNDPACRVLSANISVAGTGVDGFQHVCSDVVFGESSWTPSDNEQALRRLYRTGQKRGVRARFTSVAGTLDDTIQDVLIRKSNSIANLFG